MRFMQIESVLQTKNRSEPAKNRFSVALIGSHFELLLLRSVAPASGKKSKKIFYGEFQ